MYGILSVIKKIIKSLRLFFLNKFLTESFLLRTQIYTYVYGAIVSVMCHMLELPIKNEKYGKC